MTLATMHRRVQRVRYEIQHRNVHVAHIDRLSENFVSITFAGAALRNFVSGAFDDHVKFIFDDNGEKIMRDYTPRRFDASRNELVIEFVLHGHGKASNWARQARVGQNVTIAGPRGSMIIPNDYDWHLLIGDATALPAVRRRLEELPQNADARVLLALDHADRRAFQSDATLSLTWLDDDKALIDAVSKLALPDGEGFVWAAGESSAMTRIRDLLIVQKRHPKNAARIAAYWREGTIDYHEELTQ